MKLYNLILIFLICIFNICACTEFESYNLRFLNESGHQFFENDFGGGAIRINESNYNNYKGLIVKVDGEEIEGHLINNYVYYSLPLGYFNVEISENSTILYSAIGYVEKIPENKSIFDSKLFMLIFGLFLVFSSFYTIKKLKIKKVKFLNLYLVLIYIFLFLVLVWLVWLIGNLILSNFMSASC